MARPRGARGRWGTGLRAAAGGLWIALMGGTRTARCVASRGSQRASPRGRGRRTRQVTLEGEGSETPEHSPARVTVGLAGLWPRSASQLEAGQLLHFPPTHTPPTPELRPNGDQGGRGGPGVQALEVTLRVFRRTGAQRRAWNVLKAGSLPRTPVLPGEPHHRVPT